MTLDAGVPHAELTVDAIRAYWRAQAEVHRTDSAVSWTDRAMIDLEVRTIGAYLEPGERVLDVGCANGASTIRYARDYGVTIRGVDYIDEMLRQAHVNLASQEPDVRTRTTFALGDATCLDEPTGCYDKVVTTRVLINLGDWDHQRLALHELLRVARPGGMVLLSEATVQGFQETNAARAEWALPAIPCKPFNLYLDESRVLDELAPHVAHVDVVDYSSSYYFGTRVLKPVLETALGLEVPTDSRWNRFFAALPSWGTAGTQRLFVVRMPAR